MHKSRTGWAWAGFVLTGILGTLLHFAYDLTGQSLWAAPFAAVNESVWEHMKLLFFPMLVLAWGLRSRVKSDVYWSSALGGILLGLGGIPIVYYTGTGALGPWPDWVNIALFFAVDAVAWAAWVRLSGRDDARIGEGTARILLGCMAWLFAVLTFYPLPIPLFADPVTGLVGPQ